MTQLVYHPAFDAYNALLRIVRILLAARAGLDPTTLKILDFYLLFPDSLTKVRLTPQLRSVVKKLAATPRFPYDKIPASKALFDRMAPAYEAALQTLVSKGFVSSENGKMMLRASSSPAELLDLAREQNQNEEGLMATLLAIAEAFVTNGPNGLKDRSGLLEFRYDAV